MIRIELTELERGVLVEAIESYLSDLRMEISDTDSMDYREMLKARKEILGHILDCLESEEKATVAGKS